MDAVVCYHWNKLDQNNQSSVLRFEQPLQIYGNFFPPDISGKKTFDKLRRESRKKFVLGECDDNDTGKGWRDKAISEWSQEDTISWLISAAFNIGQKYCLIQHSLAIPGRDLIRLTKEEFNGHDPVYGHQLYAMLHSPKLFNRRPRKQKLCEFIIDLLKNRETCPSLICWEDYSQAKFKFVQSAEIAKRWGSRNGNTEMTFEKFSRALRYYYDSRIFLSVPGRLVYQFGPNAKGWQTDNPNFIN